MDTEQLEKQFQWWNRFLYLILGSASTFFIVSLSFMLNGSRWPGFESDAGGIWQWLQILATPPGFYLLWSKRWKDLPLANRLNTVFGYFLASWLALLTLAIITSSHSPGQLTVPILAGAILIIGGYLWLWKRNAAAKEEIFP